MGVGGATFGIELDGVKANICDFEVGKILTAFNFCDAFGIDRLDLVDPGDALFRLGSIATNNRSFEIRKVVSLYESIDAAQARGDTEVVLVEEKAVVGGAGMAFPEFIHNQRALYLFGRDRGPGLSGMAAEFPMMNRLLHVPSARSLHGFTTAAVVAAQRYQQLANGW
jgi:hypothetical protein